MSKVANMLNMARILEDGKKHTINELAKELEVSERMIRQYKQELEQAGIYIKGVQGINGGYVLDDIKTNIDIGLTNEEIYYLKNTAKDNYEKEIVEKIYKAYIYNCNKKNSRKIERIYPEFTEIYKDFRKAINGKNKVEIKYFSLNSGKTERIIHPAELFNYINDWYVAAFCELRNEIRLFRLANISDYKILNQKYEKEINFKK